MVKNNMDLQFLGSSTAALTQDVDMLASFPGSFPLLAVWAGPYCKQQEAGQWPWNKATDMQLATLVSRSSWKHCIIFV